MNHTPTKDTQDWQIEFLERHNKHDYMARHRNVINEMDNHPTTWGVNMSEVRKQ